MKIKVSFNFVVCALILLVSCFNVSSFAETIAMWRFEEGFGQSTVNENVGMRDLTLIRGAGESSNWADPLWAQPEGKIGDYCFHFINGQVGSESGRDYLIPAPTVDISSLRSQTFTVDVWIYLDSVPLVSDTYSNPYYILRLNDAFPTGSDTANYWLRINRDNSDPDFALLNCGWNDAPYSYEAFTYPHRLQTGVWYHVAFSHDSSKDIDDTILWVNRIPEYFTSTTEPLSQQTDPKFVIGGEYYSDPETPHVRHSFDGYIDNVRISDTVLTESEIFDPLVCGDPDTIYPPGDLNKDCRVDLADMEQITWQWLNCTNPADEDCDQFYKPEMKWSKWIDFWKSANSFPIGAWAYWGVVDSSIANLATYKNANLTMVDVPYDDYQESNSYSNAASVGLYTIIGRRYNLEIMANVEKAVNYPTALDTNTIGYLIKDEPSVDLFDQIAESHQYIYLNDYRNAIPMVDLNGYNTSLSGFSGTYQEFLNYYVETVQPSVLWNDYYPLLADGSDLANFYNNFEHLRDVSLANNIGFMGFALVTPHTNSVGTSYRRPSESDLRWEVYSMIAYGAKGVWYYNYHNWNPSDPNYGFGFVDSNNQPTETYYIAQSVNEEILNLGSVLLSLKSIEVRHTSDDVPMGTTAYTNGSISGIVSLVGANYLIGEFVNINDTGDDDIYLMLVNKSHAPDASSESLRRSVTFEVDSAYSYVYQYDSSDGILDLLSGTNNTYTLYIDGGQGVLLRLSRDLE